MNNNLVVYFSCSGETKKVAEELKNALNCDIFEIVPETVYTDRDLDWNDKNSRSTIEIGDESCRPRIRNRIDNIDMYDTIYLGFPIWWYTAPKIVNTFLDSYDFSNKKVILYCTSGGSSIDKTYNDLKNSYPDIDFIKGSRLYSNSDIDKFIKDVRQ